MTSVDLPSPRKDRRCVDCLTREAETRCGRFCKKCLKARVRGDNPDDKRPPSEQRGRAASRVPDAPKHDNYSEESSGE